MTETKRSGELVTPGEKMGVIEEFISNSGTYVEDGVIRSKNVGYILMDFANKKVSVYPATRNLNVPKVGNIIVGHVTNVQSSMAIIRIIKIGKKFISGFFTGIVHVSDVDFKYTESAFDVFRIADLVRAKIVSDKNRIFHLSTRGGNLGVIYALCSKCGNFLTLEGNRLQCDKCENVENRKIALDYGTGNI